MGSSRTTEKVVFLIMPLFTALFIQMRKCAFLNLLKDFDLFYIYIIFIALFSFYLMEFFYYCTFYFTLCFYYLIVCCFLRYCVRVHAISRLNLLPCSVFNKYNYFT